jgi:hypothetical protein
MQVFSFDLKLRIKKKSIKKKLKGIDEKMVFDNEIVKASLNYFSMAFARQF